MFRVSIDPDDDMCMCGHCRASHFMVRNRRGPFTESCCDVVIRGDGTGCPCRGFRLDTGAARDEDDGLHGYSDPRDARADRWS